MFTGLIVYRLEKLKTVMRDIDLSISHFGKLLSTEKNSAASSASYGKRIFLKVD